MAVDVSECFEGGTGLGVSKGHLGWGKEERRKKDGVDEKTRRNQRERSHSEVLKNIHNTINVPKMLGRGGADHLDPPCEVPLPMRRLGHVGAEPGSSI